MKKLLIITVLAVTALIALFFAFNAYIYNEKQGNGLPEDPQEAWFVLRGEPVMLGAGVLEYFGNEVQHDVDGDGDKDAVFLVTEQKEDGSTWFYAVAGLRSQGGYEGSHAVLIGFNIAPQSTEQGEGRVVIVNYAEQTTTGVSLGKSLHLLLDVETREFGELVQNFEGDGPRDAIPPVSTACYVGGCSSQLCTDTPNMASTCEYHESYACYQTAVCERQSSGECGWTASAELSACLADAK